MAGNPKRPAKPQVEEWLPNPPTQAWRWAGSPSSAEVTSLGFGDCVGSVGPACSQSAEPLRVLVICVAGKAHPERGVLCREGAPLE